MQSYIFFQIITNSFRCFFDGALYINQVSPKIFYYYSKTLFKMEEQKISMLRNELIEGESSPMIEDFNSKSFLEQIHTKYL